MHSFTAIEYIAVDTVVSLQNQLTHIFTIYISYYFDCYNQKHQQAARRTTCKQLSKAITSGASGWEKRIETDATTNSVTSSSTRASPAGFNGVMGTKPATTVRWQPRCFAAPSQRTVSVCGHGSKSPYGSASADSGAAAAAAAAVAAGDGGAGASASGGETMHGTSNIGGHFSRAAATVVQLKAATGTRGRH